VCVCGSVRGSLRESVPGSLGLRGAEASVCTWNRSRILLMWGGEGACVYVESFTNPSDIRGVPGSVRGLSPSGRQKAHVSAYGGDVTFPAGARPAVAGDVTFPAVPWSQIRDNRNMLREVQLLQCFKDYAMKQEGKRRQQVKMTKRVPHLALHFLRLFLLRRRSKSTPKQVPTFEDCSFPTHTTHVSAFGRACFDDSERRLRHLNEVETRGCTARHVMEMDKFPAHVYIHRAAYSDRSIL